MNIADATTQMQILLGDDVFGRLSFADENWCLEQSRIGDDYDPWIAAAEAVYLFGGRARAGQVVRFTADGATFEKTQDWTGWGDWLKSRSPRTVDAGFAFIVVGGC